MSIPIPSRQLFIDGEWREPVNRKRLSVINPSTEEVIGDIPLATSEDVELAVEAARGAVSSASIATYKVRGADGYPYDANLVGFDDANTDVVYIISVPLGDKYPVPFDQDPVAISSFHTLKKGMVDLKSAGNPSRHGSYWRILIYILPRVKWYMEISNAIPRYGVSTPPLAPVASPPTVSVSTPPVASPKPTTPAPFATPPVIATPPIVTATPPPVVAPVVVATPPSEVAPVVSAPPPALLSPPLPAPLSSPLSHQNHHQLPVLLHQQH